MQSGTPLPKDSDLTASASASRGFQREAKPEKLLEDPRMLTRWCWSCHSSATWKLARRAHSQAQAY